MQLRDAVAGVDVIEIVGDSSVDVQTVTHDSSAVEPHALFCCVPGSRRDGHDFAAAAVAAGATALLIEHPVDVDAPAARVARVRDAMAPVAARVYGEPSRSMRVVGVTGTNGKTTTVHLLEAIARAAGDMTGTIGTVGASIGDEHVAIAHTTPEAPFIQSLLARMRDRGVTTVGMEVSSEGIAQQRVDAIWFAAACFTNLSQDHLNFHGTMDAYFEAKAALFTNARTARAALNIDDEHGRVLRERCINGGIAVTTFALDDPAADVGARDIAFGARGSTFTITFAGDDAPVTLSLPGTHNVANALAAAASAAAVDISLQTIAAGLSRPLVVPGRLESVDTGQPFCVFVDYAHTPDALDRALVTVRALAESEGRVFVVFGCGGDRDREKRPQMGAIAGSRADVVVVTSDNPRSEDPAAIARAVERGVREAGASPIVELDRRAAIRYAVTHAQAGDVVLVAGKGHETGQTTNGVTVPFDDRIVAREELEAQCT